MTIKGRLKKIEKDLGIGAIDICRERMWVSTIDENGTLQGGWVNTSEYYRWHPKNECFRSSGGSFEKQRGVRYRVVFSICKSLDCPWHGHLNRMVANNQHKTSMIKTTDDLLFDKIYAELTAGNDQKFIDI